MQLHLSGDGDDNDKPNAERGGEEDEYTDLSDAGLKKCADGGASDTGVKYTDEVGLAETASDQTDADESGRDGGCELAEAEDVGRAGVAESEERAAKGPLA